MKYWMLIWVIILTNMGRYSGIVWVIIVNCHHTQEFLLQLPLALKRYRGAGWERVRDFCTQKKRLPFGKTLFCFFIKNSTTQVISGIVNSWNVDVFFLNLQIFFGHNDCCQKMRTTFDIQKFCFEAALGLAILFMQKLCDPVDTLIKILVDKFFLLIFSLSCIPPFANSM